MKRKTYERPTAEVVWVRQETELLALSVDMPPVSMEETITFEEWHFDSVE